VFFIGGGLVLWLHFVIFLFFLWAGGIWGWGGVVGGGGGGGSGKATKRVVNSSPPSAVQIWE